MRKNLQNVVAVIGIACVLLGGAAFGAPPLAPNDPELDYSFFFMMDQFSQRLDERSQQYPARRTKLMESAARYFKVGTGDLPIITAKCQAAVAALRQIEGEARLSWAAAKTKGKAPDPAVLRGFAARRSVAIQNGIDSLRQALSPSAWNGLNTHINGEHRASIQRQP